MFYKKAVLKLFKKVAGLQLAHLFKETSPQVFSCGFYQILQNTVFAQHIRATACAKYHIIR